MRSTPRSKLQHTPEGCSKRSNTPTKSLILHVQHTLQQAQQAARKSLILLAASVQQHTPITT